MKDKLLLKEIRDRYASQGWANAWCDSCGAIAVYCPECGVNACGNQTKDCGTCGVAYNKQIDMWNETDSIIQRMCEN